MTDAATVTTKDEGPDLPRRFIDLSEWDKALSERAQPILEVVMKQQGEQLLTRLGASPDVFAVFNRNIPKAAAQLSLKFAASTNATTTMHLDDALKRLRQEISDGLVEGDTRVELRKRVQQVFDTATKERAEVIARTEASRATHAAEQMSAERSGLKMTKTWLASADACPACEAMAALGPIPVDKTFAELGGEYGSVDGAPLHPNCQCSLVWSVDESELAAGERL